MNKEPTLGTGPLLNPVVTSVSGLLLQSPADSPDVRLVNKGVAKVTCRHLHLSCGPGPG